MNTAGKNRASIPGRCGAAIAAIVCIVILIPESSSAAITKQPPPFVVGVIPPHPTAAIFSNFADVNVDTTALSTIQCYLQKEGYAVSSFAGGESIGAGSATLPNFLSMANDGVVIINSHGLRPDATVQEHQCPGRQYKGLYSVPGPPGSKKQHVPEATTCLLNKEEAGWFKLPAHVNFMQVEWYAPGPNSLSQALSQYATYTQVDGYSALDLKLVDDNAFENFGDPPRSRYGPFILAISQAGLAKYFSHSQIGIVDAIVCHSLYFAPSFNALTYFGYKQTTCAPAALSDQLKLWGRLVGLQGVRLRDTVSAQNAGGFTEAPCPCLAPGYTPVVLSPAVAQESATGVNPTVVDFYFDALMDTSDAGAAQITNIVTSGAGCGSVSPAKWINPIDLQFTVTPDPFVNGSGQVNVRLPAIAFEAQPGGMTNAELDGNQNPPGTNGVLPNGDDWIGSGLITCGIQPGGGG
jgi:hypothetical protein